jgi:hypothetical protein
LLGGPPEQAQQIELGMIDTGLTTQGRLDEFDTAFAVTNSVRRINVPVDVKG